MLIRSASNLKTTTAEVGYLRRVERWDLNGESDSADFVSTDFATASTQPAPVETLDKEEKDTRTLAVLVDEDVITPEVLESFAKAAAKIDVLENSPNPSRWKAMARELRETETLNPEHLNDIRKFARDVRSHHRELHRAYRDSDYSDKKISRELEDVHVFLHQFEETRNRYLEVSSQVALEAMAGATFGPSAAVAAYVAWAQPSQSRVADLMNELEALENGSSRLMHGGNAAEPIHQHELWQKKMQLLDSAIESGEAGKPVEIDLQYYELTSQEFMAKVALAAKAGNKIRVNIDPSRPGTGVFHGTRIDSGPRRLRALLQLSNMKDVDVAVSVYPVYDKLGSLDKLMHRKFFRVGDQVILGGMNANDGSGENVDAAYLIEGPAARALTQVFAQDVSDSKGVTLEQVYGSENLSALVKGDPAVSALGLLNLLDAVTGPTNALSPLPSDPSLDQMEAAAKKAGYKLAELIDLPAEKIVQAWDSPYGRRKALPLSENGKEMLAQLGEKVFEATLNPENQKRLQDISLPSGEVKGKAEIGIASLPTEREALLLHAISTAEEFIYVPTFVITRAVARAMAARRDELKAEGKKLDIRVVADAGVYPFGGTPNEHGVLALEDADIPVRWSLLPRSTRAHDRKIHAKQIITDKMEFVGSTNLSNAGMQENWELSGLVVFDENDADSMAAREESVEGFKKIWNNESFVLNTRKVAEKRLDGVNSKDYEMRLEEARNSAIRSLLNLIRNFEHQSADWVEEQLATPEVAQRFHELSFTGMAEGYAKLMAVEEHYGTTAFYSELNSLEAMTKIRSLRRYG